MCPPGTDGAGPAAGVTRVVLLDEYPAVLDALATLLDGHPDFHVVAKVRTGAELLEVTSRERIDLVVAEPWLRSGDGLHALRTVSQAPEPARVVALSRMWDRQRVDPLVQIGVRAYIPKSLDLHRIPPILRGAMDGLVTLPDDTGPSHGQALLTPREAEVLRMASDGLDNRAIAEVLVVSDRTVKFHLQNAYRKLGVTNRTAASAAARRLGIIQ